jgi:hypothetical protein
MIENAMKIKPTSQDVRISAADPVEVTFVAV